MFNRATAVGRTVDELCESERSPFSISSSKEIFPPGSLSSCRHSCLPFLVYLRFSALNNVSETGVRRDRPATRTKEAITSIGEKSINNG